MASGPITSWQIDGETMETVRDLIFLSSQIAIDGDCSHEVKRHPWKKSYDQPRQYIKKQRNYFANKGPSSQSYGFSSSHVWLWELDHKESWAPKNWCFWTVMWRRLLRVPCTARRWNKSILKEISPKYWLEGLMLKLQYFGHLMWRTGKDPGAGRDWRQGKRTTEDELVEWHHQLYGHRFEQAWGAGDGQGSLACCSPWDQSQARLSEVNWPEKNAVVFVFIILLIWILMVYFFATDIYSVWVIC